MLGQRLQIFGIVVTAEDSAVYRRVQRLQPPVHHLRKPGVCGDVADLDAFALQVPPGAAGAVDFHPGGSQPPGEAGQPEFVADANQGTLNRR